MTRFGQFTDFLALWRDYANGDHTTVAKGFGKVSASTIWGVLSRSGQSKVPVTLVGVRQGDRVWDEGGVIDFPPDVIKLFVMRLSTASKEPSQRH